VRRFTQQPNHRHFLRKENARHSDDIGGNSQIDCYLYWSGSKLWFHFTKLFMIEFIPTAQTEPSFLEKRMQIASVNSYNS
jgi:hypothetical protein